MNRFLAKDAPLAPEKIIALDPEESAHAARVLRLKAGDTVSVFDGQGREFTARLERVSSRETIARLERERAPARESFVPIALAFGLTKRKAADLTIQKAVELGATSAQAFVSERSVARAEGAEGDDANRRERWERIVRDATKQCGRARLMRTPPVVSWKALLEAAPSDAARFVAWETSRESGAPRLSEAVRAATSVRTGNAPSAVWLAVGPEGGFTASEVEAAEARGWKRVSLGARVLRAETAAMAALAATLAGLGDI